MLGLQIHTEISCPLSVLYIQYIQYFMYLNYAGHMVQQLNNTILQVAY